MQHRPLIVFHGYDFRGQLDQIVFFRNPGQYIIIHVIQHGRNLDGLFVIIELAIGFVELAAPVVPPFLAAVKTYADFEVEPLVKCRRVDEIVVGTFEREFAR